MGNIPEFSEHGVACGPGENLQGNVFQYDLAGEAFTQLFVTACVVAPTFLLFCLHLLNKLRNINAAWARNKAYRKARKASNNIRLRFDARGRLVGEDLLAVRHIQDFEWLVERLGKLAEQWSFLDAALKQHQPSLKITKEVAERCKQGVCNFLSLKGTDKDLLSSLARVGPLVHALANEVPYAGDPVQVLNEFKEQLAVIHCAFSHSDLAKGSWTYKGDAKKGIEEALLGPEQVGKRIDSVPDFARNPIPKLVEKATAVMRTSLSKECKRKEDLVRPRTLEPATTADEVCVRGDGPLRWAVEERDKLGISSRRLTMALVAVLIAFGPVRFLGLPATYAAYLFLAAELLLDLLKACEASTAREAALGCFGRLKMGAYRMVLPLCLGAMLFLFGDPHEGQMYGLSPEMGYREKFVNDFEHMGTFLTVPPWYSRGFEGLPGGRTATHYRSWILQTLHLDPPVNPAPPGQLNRLWGETGGWETLLPLGLKPFCDKSGDGSILHILVIFSIMHSCLLTLSILPLPVCYRLQAQFVERYPHLRWMVPRNPVWLHRMLGYVLIGGLLTGVMTWLVTMGAGCLREREFHPQLCDAFAPKNPDGQDVFFLRFHVVWPCMFFMIPLLIFDRFPDEAPKGEGAPAAGERGSASGEARPLLLVGSDEENGANGTRGGAGAAGTEGREDAEKPRCVEIALRFIYRRIVEVSLLVISLAGTRIVFHERRWASTIPPEVAALGIGSAFPNKYFFPLWPCVLVAVALHVAVKFRAFLVDRLGFHLGRDVSSLRERGDELAALWKQQWWEIAYGAHVLGVFFILGWALYLRPEVFFLALPTWGVYFYDRWQNFRDAYRRPSAIVVDDRKASYVVQGPDGKPSFVRLVVKRPEGFQYRAGQWCFLALQSCGSHLRAPGWALPLLQWHAFSLASAEHEDDLEFHIAVCGDRAASIVRDDTTVTVSSGAAGTVKLSRRGHWIDWLFPHTVPAHGPTSSLGWLCGSACQARTCGGHAHLDLDGPDGGTVRVSQPQAQWTGRLWSIVEWMLQMHQGKKDVPEQVVRIMGPYGTLPYTCEAHNAVMLIGAGIGFPSVSSLLGKVLADNLSKPDGEPPKAVCFMWAATKVDQLQLCFPHLLVDLTKYVHQRSIEELRSWLTVKIFVSRFDASDCLSVSPDERLFPNGGRGMEKALESVRAWLLNRDSTPVSVTRGDGKDDGSDEDGTYIAECSIGAVFGDVLRCSRFTREHVVAKRNSLGICYCGPSDLCSWIKAEQANTILPVKVEFNSETAG